MPRRSTAISGEVAAIPRGPPLGTTRERLLFAIPRAPRYPDAAPAAALARRARYRARHRSADDGDVRISVACGADQAAVDPPLVGAPVAHAQRREARLRPARRR